MKHDLLWLAACAGYVATIVLLFGIEGTPVQAAESWVLRQAEVAAVFFVPSITVTDISNDYHAAIPSPSLPEKKVKILIVPGHQPQKGGTDYHGVYERDIVVDIADTLRNLLSQNPHYDVMVARTKTAWDPTLQSYLDTHALEIETFRQSQIAQMLSHLADGSIVPQADQVYHLKAPSDAAFQLYGINKWSSDAHDDIVIHLHINDYAGRRAVRSDSYTGFAIYVPDHQYSNAVASIAIGKSIANRLNAYHATSTLPKEDQGVVEDQELIAIGSNNSADSAAVLVEYGYIYEPQFQNESTRSLALTDYAYQTYLGLQDFFNDSPQHVMGSLALPYAWQPETFHAGDKGPAIYALQAALRYLGYYPAPPARLSACPISGVYGGCTDAALRAYQRASGLRMTGSLSAETIAALQSSLGATPVSSPLTLR
jgi:N-acetylmuramoyl-L-alanine amidase